MRDGGVRTRGGGVRTRGGGVRNKGGGVRTRGGGVRTREGHIYDDPYFPINDASLDFPSSSHLQHTALTFSTPLDQSLPHSSVPSIDEGDIHLEMMWQHKCNTFLHHLLNNKERIRFKIKDVDENEDEDEEMEQH
ncbi:hypothetical protein CK203_105808 [Vitis vinifera]|uniref:Uncharacterized protein n=1 Tax=Vitis vinifera TaxID=29760 RepID=A0A438D7Q6_VITVI|nr:hypothetical protein CK203_105808 [Vitis vinifera]